MGKLLRHATAAAIALALVAAPAASASVPKSTQTAKLLVAATARVAPGGKVLAHIAADRPLSGTPTVLPVLGTRALGGQTWLEVLLPERPNGAHGWIDANGVLLSSTPWRITVTLSSRRAAVYRAGRLVRSFRVVVGKPSTPTPRGQFFVAERVRQPRGSALGPWVLATSAYSNVLQDFDGGPGQIGLHGRTGLPGALGTAASHGCVRFADTAIAWVAAHARPGTPITIRG